MLKLSVKEIQDGVPECKRMHKKNCRKFTHRESK